MTHRSSSVESQSGPSLFERFAGRETPLPAEVLASLYSDADEYLDAFTEDLDATIDAGFLLRQHRAEILEAATEKAESILPAS